MYFTYLFTLFTLLALVKASVAVPMAVQLSEVGAVDSYMMEEGNNVVYFAIGDAVYLQDVVAGVRRELGGSGAGGGGSSSGGTTLPTMCTEVSEDVLKAHAVVGAELTRLAGGSSGSSGGGSSSSSGGGSHAHAHPELPRALIVVEGCETLIELGQDVHGPPRAHAQAQAPVRVLMQTQPLSQLDFVHRVSDSLPDVTGVAVLLLWNTDIVALGQGQRPWQGDGEWKGAVARAWGRQSHVSAGAGGVCMGKCQDEGEGDELFDSLTTASNPHALLGRVTRAFVQGADESGDGDGESSTTTSSSSSSSSSGALGARPDLSLMCGGAHFYGYTGEYSGVYR